MPYRAKTVIIIPYKAKFIMPYKAKAVIIIPYETKIVKIKI